MRVKKLTGLKEARERFAEEMANRYQYAIAEVFAATAVTHVSERICPCYGCRKRREWHTKK